MWLCLCNNTQTYKTYKYVPLLCNVKIVWLEQGHTGELSARASAIQTFFSLFHSCYLLAAPHLDLARHQNHMTAKELWHEAK